MVTRATGDAHLNTSYMPSADGDVIHMLVPWNEKADRAEKILLTAKEQAGFDRGHRQQAKRLRRRVPAPHNRR